MPEPYDILAMSEANPDGGGVGRWDGERSRTLTGFIFSHWEQLENTPCLIHFRLATHGAVEPRDCHPPHTDRRHIAHDGTAYGHENGPYASDSRNTVHTWVDGGCDDHMFDGQAPIPPMVASSGWRARRLNMRTVQHVLERMIDFRACRKARMI